MTGDRQPCLVEQAGLPMYVLLAAAIVVFVALTLGTWL